MIGKTISHYKIIEKLGEGGMGVVYKAEDTKLKRIIALKFLSAIALGGEDKSRFLREAQAAAALNHPNICTIHAIDEVDGQMFIVMEFIEGQSLRERIEDGPSKIEDAIKFAVQVADGLQAAHEKGITHRDIKSANIMVTESGQVKIMDFGLAKIAGGAQLTKDHSTLGTVAYMSPEQARGEPVDHRTDIWAFGVVLYEMLTGQLPFRGEYEAAMMYSILNEEPEPASSLQSDMPAGFEAVLKKALAKKSDERYQNMSDVIADLKNLFVGTLSAMSTTKQSIPDSKPSIAVMPFANMSADPEQEYFCDGMAEEIINALTQLRELRVVARTSAFSFKGQNTDIRAIGEKLKVETILEGSVRKAGNRLRITAQLIKVADGYHLWSQRYDRQLDDVFAIQDEISLSIVEKLKTELFGEQPQVLVQRVTDNMEAYNLYLKGLHYRRKWSPQTAPQAVACFKQAIELDPEFAKPYASLAGCYTEMTDVGGLNLLFRDEAYPLIKDAVDKALTLENALAEAHVVLGLFNCVFEWDWPGGEQACKRALELNSNDVSTLIWCAYYYWITGCYDEAIAIMHRAEALDPLSLVTQHMIGGSYFFARRFDEAIERCQHIIEMDDHYFLAYIYLSSSFACKSEFEQALATCQKALPIFGRHPVLLHEMARLYGRWGKRSEVLQLNEEIEMLSEKYSISPILFAWTSIALGDQEEAIAHIEKAFEKCDLLIPFFLNWPWPEVESLRSHPRIQAVMQKMGLEL